MTFYSILGKRKDFVPSGRNVGRASLRPPLRVAVGGSRICGVRGSYLQPRDPFSPEDDFLRSTLYGPSNSDREVAGGERLGRRGLQPARRGRRATCSSAGLSRRRAAQTQDEAKLVRCLALTEALYLRKLNFGPG